MKETKPFEESLRQTQIIRFAMIFAPTLFAGVVLYLSQDGGTANRDESLERMLLLAFSITTVSCLTLSFFIPKMILRRAERAEISERMNAYRQAHTMMGAMAEGSALLWGVLGLLSHNPIYLVGLVVCLLVLILHFPTKNNFEDYLRMRAEDANSKAKAST